MSNDLIVIAKTELITSADALILLTHWSEFRRLDLDRIRQAMRFPLLVDGRNLYDPSEMVAKGFFYQPIGRPTQEPVTLSETNAPRVSETVFARG